MDAANVAATSTATVPALDASAPATAANAAIPDLASDPSIAVLPLANMSSDKEQEYFSDGISWELLNLPAKVPKLRVIAHTTSFAFKGKEVGTQEVARQLHVAAVLEGSVRKSGDKVRITLQPSCHSGAPCARSHSAGQGCGQSCHRDRPVQRAAHGFLARIAADIEGDLPTAAREMQRAMDLDPTNPSILNNSAALLTSMGQVEESATVFKYLAAHDPASAIIQGNLSLLRYSAGRCDKTDVANRTALALSPGYTSSHCLLGLCEVFRKRPDRAIAEMQAEPDDVSRLSGLAIAHWSRGGKTQADAWLAQLLRQHSTDGAYYIATIYAWRGDADATFTWLDKAIALKDANLTAIQVEPLFQPVHGDPRWLPFLRRIGRAPEQLANVSFKVTLPE